MIKIHLSTPSFSRHPSEYYSVDVCGPLVKSTLCGFDAVQDSATGRSWMSLTIMAVQSVPSTGSWTHRVFFDHNVELSAPSFAPIVEHSAQAISWLVWFDSTGAELLRVNTSLCRGRTC